MVFICNYRRSWQLIYNRKRRHTVYIFQYRGFFTSHIHVYPLLIYVILALFVHYSAFAPVSGHWPMTYCPLQSPSVTAWQRIIFGKVADCDITDCTTLRSPEMNEGVTFVMSFLSSRSHRSSDYSKKESRVWKILFTNLVKGTWPTCQICEFVNIKVCILLQMYGCILNMIYMV